jgi:hypothetical protein
MPQGEAGEIEAKMKGFCNYLVHKAKQDDVPARTAPREAPLAAASNQP